MFIFSRKPGIIVTAQETGDVQKSVIFANKHNIRITVMSSGHCFIGRPAEDGSLLINLQSLKRLTINKEASHISDTGVIAIAQPAVDNRKIHSTVCHVSAGPEAAANIAAV